MKNAVLIYHQDPGHGWLAVPKDIAREVGVTDADFSRYSYQDDLFLYLEEDGDMSAFMNLWRDRCGIFPQLIDKHSDWENCQEHWIRSLDRCSGARWVSPFARVSA